MIDKMEKERERFLNAGFSIDQVNEIIEGQKAGLNVAIYANPQYNAIQMRQIRLGLSEKLPVEKYADAGYDWFQMEEIREGLRAGVDTSMYASKDVPYEVMRQLRKGLQCGMNLYNFRKLNPKVLRQLRKAKVENINIIKYINEGYDEEQLEQIRLAMRKGINLDPYLLKEYRGPALAEIREGLEKGLDVSVYAKLELNWEQMREIRLGLEHRIDVSKYQNTLFSFRQMKEIRIGLEQGLDVTGYGRLCYPSFEMRRKRKELLGVLKEQDAQIQMEDFVITVSSSELEAYLSVQKKPQPIRKKKIMNVLQQNGICEGLIEDNIKLFIDGKYTEKSVLIAQGKVPKKGEDGWYEYFFRTNVDKKPKVLEDGSVDYQDVEWFENVKQGQVLAVYHEATDGEDGFTVKGNVLQARKGFEEHILTGQGFTLDADRKTYRAAMDGLVKLDGHYLEISKHLVVDDVTTATGNINFNGSVQVLGEVGDGVTIKASGDVVVDGTVGAAIIESNGSILLKQGMNAFGGGYLKADKNVTSKFLETVKVEAGENIQTNTCLNSQLYAEGKITVLLSIIGGVACAERGFVIQHLGNKIGMHTVLKLEFSESFKEERKDIYEKYAEAEKELQILKRMYGEFHDKFPPEVRNSMEQYLKLEKAVFAKEKWVEELKLKKVKIDGMLKKMDEARVIINGQAHEGSVVEVRGARWEAANQTNITLRRVGGSVEWATN